MKMQSRMVFIGVLALFGLVVTGRADVAGENDAMAEIREVIDRYRESGDRQDPSLVEGALAADFALYYKGADGWVRSDRAGYIGALSAKVIGGEERAMTIHRIEVNGPVASAHVRFSSKSANFDQFINFVATDDGWRIVGLVLNYTPA